MSRIANLPSGLTPVDGLVRSMILVASCCVISGVAQEVRHDAGPSSESPRSIALPSFVGTWKGKFKEQTFAVLKLHMEGEKLTGSLSTAETINLDSDGAIHEVEGEATEDKATPVLDAKLVGKFLLFKNQGAGDDEIDTYKMELSNQNTAGLKPTGAPEGMKVRPFPLVRDEGKR